MVLSRVKDMRCTQAALGAALSEGAPGRGAHWGAHGETLIQAWLSGLLQYLGWTHG